MIEKLASVIATYGDVEVIIKVPNEVYNAPHYVEAYKPVDIGKTMLDENLYIYAELLK